jgi:hypothetical protein
MRNWSVRLTELMIAACKGVCVHDVLFRQVVSFDLL